jgi:predicted ATPase
LPKRIFNARCVADAELIYVRGIPPDATYQFKHALIRDAAYEALLKSRRRGLHHRVALTITERFSAMAEAQPEVLARHWTEAAENRAGDRRMVTGGQGSTDAQRV